MKNAPAGYDLNTGNLSVSQAEINSISVRACAFCSSQVKSPDQPFLKWLAMRIGLRN